MKSNLLLWGSLRAKFNFEHFLACQKRVWPSTKWYRNCSCPKLHTPSKHAPISYQIWKVLYAKQPTPNRKSHWVKGWINNFIPLVTLHAQRLCLNLTEELPLPWGSLRATLILCTSWHAKMSLTLNELLQNALRSILHTTTSKNALKEKILWNMKGVGCKTTNSLLKVMLS